MHTKHLVTESATPLALGFHSESTSLPFPTRRLWTWGHASTHTLTHTHRLHKYSAICSSINVQRFLSHWTNYSQFLSQNCIVFISFASWFSCNPFHGHAKIFFLTLCYRHAFTSLPSPSRVPFTTLHWTFCFLLSLPTACWSLPPRV